MLYTLCSLLIHHSKHPAPIIHHTHHPAFKIPLHIPLTFSQSNDFPSSCAFATILFFSVGLLMSSLIASTMACVSWASTKSAFSRSRSKNGIPPTLVVTTGSPKHRASITLTGVLPKSVVLIKRL